MKRNGLRFEFGWGGPEHPFSLLFPAFHTPAHLPNSPSARFDRSLESCFRQLMGLQSSTGTTRSGSLPTLRRNTRVVQKIAALMRLRGRQCRSTHIFGRLLSLHEQAELVYIYLRRLIRMLSLQRQGLRGLSHDQRARNRTHSSPAKRRGCR